MSMLLDGEWRSTPKLLLLLLIALSLAGCSHRKGFDLDVPRFDHGAAGAGTAGTSGERASMGYVGKEDPRFTDVTLEAGLQFHHETGAFGQKYMPETMGSGCAFVDYDRDGQEDILLINGEPWPGHGRAGQPLPTMKLYQNEGHGHFSDVTQKMGLAVPLYGMGAAVGDYDNDGWDDLLITALGGSHLFHNDHGRRFVDVTDSSGIHDGGWPTSALWVDYDRDGLLDLFVCHYVKWTPATDVYMSADGIHKSYATPEPYAGETCRLYHNDGHGHFRDVTIPTGIFSSHSKALSVVALDYNGDGWPDIFVTNDTQPNFLYQNQGDGRFKQVGLEAAVAVSDQGKARAGMGCDTVDYDGSGRLSLAATNFSGEQLALYHNDGGGLFTDRAAQSGIGPPSERFLSFGLLFLDFDMDGHPDLFVNNGHIMDDIGARMTGVGYAERPLLFHNEGNGRFRECATACGPAFIAPRVGRGAARGDFNNDGSPDILLTTNDDGAYLFRNDTHLSRPWVGIKLLGRASNRDGFGTTVKLSTPAGEQFKEYTAGGSYLSAMDPRLRFALYGNPALERFYLHWPSGRTQVIPVPTPGRYTTIEEPQ